MERISIAAICAFLIHAILLGMTFNNVSQKPPTMYSIPKKLKLNLNWKKTESNNPSQQEPQKELHPQKAPVVPETFIKKEITLNENTIKAPPKKITPLKKKIIQAPSEEPLPKENIQSEPAPVSPIENIKKIETRPIDTNETVEKTLSPQVEMTTAISVADANETVEKDAKDFSHEKEQDQTVVKLARPLYKINPPPLYPKRAKKRNQQGVVLLDVLVQKNGQVKEVKINTSSGYNLLDTAALKSVNRWHFEPGLKNEFPVSMWVKVPVRFEIK